MIGDHTTGKGDPVGRLMMLGRPLSPSSRCEDLPHPRATVRRNGDQHVVTVWEAPYVISEQPGSITNHRTRADALAWAHLQVIAARTAAGQIKQRGPVSYAIAA